jgi:hypothetical protein
LDVFKNHRFLIRRLESALAGGALVLAALVSDPTPGPGTSPEAAPDSAEVARREAAYRSQPMSQRDAQTFRVVARDAGQIDRAIAVFAELAKAQPEEPVPALEHALALVDQLADPTLDLPRRAVIASQANRSLNAILDRDPAHWAARYVRGMTHLLWPRLANHSQAAVDDLERLVVLQSTLPPATYHVRGHLALGDAYAMNVQRPQARTAWLEGRKLYPNDKELSRRLAMTDEEIETFILATYTLETPFDTDLSFLWQK